MSYFSQFKHSIAPFRKVRHVQFGILSPDEIRAMSVCEIRHPEALENGEPKAHGLLDPRLGTVSRDWACATCEGDAVECPGHWGHMELATPMFQIHFLPVVIKVLRSICKNCSKLLIDKDDEKFKLSQTIKDPQERLRAVYDLCKGKKVCEGDETALTKKEDEEEEDANAGKLAKKKKKTKGRHGCGSAQPKIMKDGTRLRADYSKAGGERTAAEVMEGDKKQMSAQHVYELFKGISNEDCIALGLNPKYSRPDWMICSVFPVPPPHVRPSVYSDTAKTAEDDLTYKIADIIKASNRLRQQMENNSPAHILSEYEDLLQFHLNTFVNNEMDGQLRATQRNGRPLKTIVQRLKGKEGRVRGNLMGKRVDFSARSVITADPNLSIDEVGVPRVMAMKMTYPEIVTPWNIKKMHELVANGPNEYPGALGVIKDDGSRVDLRFVQNTKDLHLSNGYKVERHLQNGDYVIFNRQPSLHKMSMMGHKARVMPYSTFRLNLSCTTPYNADFDGDEMNMHVAQSLETRAEIQEIMMVPKQIITPKANRPVIGVVQDALLGASLFTRRDVFMEKDVVMNLLLWIKDYSGELPKPAILKPKPLWTGKQIFSLILPVINLRDMKSIAHEKKFDEAGVNAGDTEVLVEQGEVLTGILDKKALGTSEGGLVHLLWMEYGPESAKQFLNQTQAIVNYWMLQRAYTIGVSDTIADESTLLEVTNISNAAKSKVHELIIQLYEGQLERKPGNTLMDTFEVSVNTELNKARDDAGKEATDKLSRANNINMMVKSGSKGSTINISQIIGLLGQQNVEGKRIPFGFKRRTLPHFTKNDYGAESRGFVENSYLKGLTPQEFYFHTMGGREGIIDTAVKTAETGYVQRRLIKAMEDAVVLYDTTVRNSLGEVIQFLYGEDGLDPLGVEKQKIESMRLSNVDAENRYQWKLEKLDNEFGNLLDQDMIESIRDDAQTVQMLAGEWRAIQDDRRLLRETIFPDGTDAWPLPVNISRLLVNAQKRFPTEANAISELHPKYIIDKVRSLGVELRVNPPGDDRLTEEARVNSTMLFNMLLRSSLSSKRVLKDYKLNRQSFDWLLGEIRSRFNQAVVNPGESVGIVAAQSIGEPATQMTLNTFHFAGVSAKNVTLGVPRLKELINVARNPKTPSMKVWLQPQFSSDAEAAKTVERKIEFATMKRVAAITQIWYDPNPRETVIEEDADIVAVNYDFPQEDEAANIDKLSPWLLRIEVDREAMVDKKLKLVDLVAKLDEYFKKTLNTITNDENSDKLVLRIRVQTDRLQEQAGADPDQPKEEQAEEEETTAGDDLVLRLVEQKLDQVKLCGIPGVEKVFLVKEKVTRIDDNGAYSDQKREPWILDTEGTNLLETLSCPEVDVTRTISNDIVEVFEVLGIEGARGALLDEVRKVISFDGSYVNYRHIAMLIDIMTHRGHLKSITRHGINRGGTGPLMRCSFEETQDMLTEAAIYAEDDILRGVSENVLLGNTAPIGTGYFELYLNDKALNNAVVFPMVGMAADTEMLDYENPTSPQSFDPLMSPAMMSPMHSPYTNGGAFSPYTGGSFSPFSPASPRGGSNYSPMSPSYSPMSPGYSPTSPSYSPTSPSYSPTSPSYSPTSPSYSPTSPRYSPTSPKYSPTSPGYSPTSPGYSPTSPKYSPTSPGYSPTSPRYSPTSPKYSPTSPTYSPTSPRYSPTSPTYSPTSPRYSPTSPTYSPTSPRYSPTSPNYSPTSPRYSPTSPTYSPSSPAYSPSNSSK